jgi:hypothetical protein
MPQYLLLIDKQLSPGFDSTWFTSRSPSGLPFKTKQREVGDCGGRNSISQTSHVVPAASCFFANACDDEIILRTEANATGDYWCFALNGEMTTFAATKRDRLDWYAGRRGVESSER